MATKTYKEMEDMLDKCLTHKQKLDQNLSGMTYADGIEAALRWVIHGGDEPIDKEDCK